ncbi:MAG: tetratricopeptide repeat protein [Saprospiraceae bacterium]
MKTGIAILMILIASVPVSLWSQEEYPWLRTGDHLYDKGQYQDTETAYRKANELKPAPGTSYNLGNSIYQQKRIPEAITEYQKALESGENPEVRSRAFYNLGNAQFESGAYQESINAYKESLKLNPTDEDAKKNLMLAMRRLQQQQQEQQQQNKEQQQEENKDEEKKEEEKEQEQQQQQQQEQSKPEQKENVNKDEAKEILKAIEREDQRVQEKLKKAAGKSVPPVKDW